MAPAKSHTSTFLSALFCAPPAPFCAPPALRFLNIALTTPPGHGSDSVENGQKEIALWFPEGISQYKLSSADWVYEQ